jgi:hypothetical protein
MHESQSPQEEAHDFIPCPPTPVLKNSSKGETAAACNSACVLPICSPLGLSHWPTRALPKAVRWVGLIFF